MSVSATYAQPVIVNGYACWNCKQVAEAKKDVNPASRGAENPQAPGQSPAVLFGGMLAQSSISGATATPAIPNSAANPPFASSTLNLLV